MTKKKLFGTIGKIALGFIPGGGAVMEAAKVGGELAVGALLAGDDDEKTLYREWYKLAMGLRDGEFTNERRKEMLLDRIRGDLAARDGIMPGETDLMFNFYMVVRDVKGGFEAE